MVAPKLIPHTIRATLSGVTISPTRFILGFLVALAIAGGARAAHSLSWSGAAAAVCIGTIAVAAGWDWGAILILYFVLSTAISRFRGAQKATRTNGIVAKGGERDAIQVFANGGVFAGLALLHIVAPHPAWHWGALGALAASAADTWATEIGTLYGGNPRSILRGTNVRPGISGGVTWFGSFGGLLGAATIAAIGWMAGWHDGATLAAPIVLLAGMIGMLADSVLGATVQERRWCEQCNAPTERIIHSCSNATRHVGGISWIGNDAVNALATAIGALAALLAALAMALPSPSWAA